MASFKPSLKPVVASLLCMGVVGGSAFAAATTTNALSGASVMDSALMQNRAGGGQMPDWYNRITLSGQANVDFRMANRAPIPMLTAAPAFGNGATDLSLFNASVFADAKVNEWTNAHVHLLYGQNSPSFVNSSANAVGSADAGMGSVLDEGIVTIGNASRTPFYFQAGHEYVPFGDYSRYAMTTMVQSLTQLLSMTRATAAQVGFADTSGFSGALYTFRGIQQAGTLANHADLTRVQNWGANLAYGNSYTDMGYKLAVGYLRNMADVLYINSSGGLGAAGVAGSYIDKVGGLSADLDMNYSGFDGALHYVTALQSFNVADLFQTGSPAKPNAWGVDLGYSFNTMDHISRIGLGYQRSHDSVGVGIATGSVTPSVGLPKYRWLANYVVNLSHCTDLGVEIYNDKAYNVTDTGGFTGTTFTGSDKNATVGVIRLGVKWV